MKFVLFLVRFLAVAAVIVVGTEEAESTNNKQLKAKVPLGDHENYVYFAFQLSESESNAVTGNEFSANKITETNSNNIEKHSIHSLRRRRLLARADDVVADVQTAINANSNSLNPRNVNTNTNANDSSDSNGIELHFLGPVGELADYFHVAVPLNYNVAKRDQFAEVVSNALSSHPNIIWTEHQIPVVGRLVKRAFISIADARTTFEIADPEFQNQWHLLNQTPGQLSNDHNVTAAWAQGIFGNSSVVCFVDDGLDHEASDIKDNYFADGSYDFNVHITDPRPKSREDRHGTRCAGEVAAVKNKVCGVGIAYHAKVSAVRILGGALTEADEAASINYKMQENHIYSCSWGPTDNGATMEAPPRIVSDAVINGVNNGRGGLGSIFVFASGNGGGAHDNCNFDGYTNSIYTITVSAIDRNNKHPPYSELCAANLVVMYSSAAARHDDAIATTDWEQGHSGDLCTKSHGGTSAAAPLASGIYALVNSIRSDLSWRDYQHISVRSAVPISTTESSWFTTAAGRLYSHEFGYGKLDAYQILEIAKTWSTVAPQTSFTTPILMPSGDGKIPQDPGSDIRVEYTVTAEELAEVRFSKLEHVTVTVTIEHGKRGDVNVDLISPAGIVSNLAVTRPGDNANTGFGNWTFMSVAHWDEEVVGTWKIVVRDPVTPEKSGVFKNAFVKFWGSEVATVKKKPGLIEDIVPSDSESSLITQSAIPAEILPALSSSNLDNKKTQDTNHTVTPDLKSNGRASVWIFAILALGTLGVGSYYAYQKRKEVLDVFQSWQQHQQFNQLDEELFEFQRLSGEDFDENDGDFGGTGLETDEFDDIEGPSEAELEELRKGGYLVDDLLSLDTTQQQNL
ncbi:pheromone processing endoprotease [Physocladia obscura]|uniref:Pheromone processing endoprotease n=1 Tax=Physocladia obscura TaxID=109957 RepID=A0AAD5XHB8_9FUNG|nr:pheromone processing endoprotease [Physocladia obscura]